MRIADEQKQNDLFDLAERFQAATDAEDVNRLGDEMGRMIFGEGADCES